MTFEKALEAMRQGKSVIYKDSECHYILSVFDDYIVGIDGYYRIEDVAFRSSCLLSDDWEIYEEPLKEPEMTVEKAITLLNKAILVIAESRVKRIGCCTSENIIKAIQFAIHSLENQNQQELVFDPENLSQKELEKVQEKLKECKLEVNLEKKCECERKCNHTVEDADSQEEMKKTLKDKFFELADTTTDSLSVSNMIEIYRLLFEVQP